MMKNWIPIDLTIDILSRLPAKSIARFPCVSKQWRSTLCRKDFTELFLTGSSDRPRLLICVLKDGMSKYRGSYACGLIYIPRADDDTKRVICNPITGQYLILPELRKAYYGYSYLGFDPIDKEFKVLLMDTSSDHIASSDAVHYICTLGSELGWRMSPLGARICINGVLYYLALHSYGMPFMIVCFDVRSEKFSFIDVDSSWGLVSSILINYRGELGITYWENLENRLKNLQN
ncbi:hypothetical protein AALP_AA1G315800 [Arabis alpina]|uniref:F-box domain-containing protein n=1 Tax=Arabis alpina TaxID=50452 RepID=A0A087HRY5_ARAAL|nr:hypothetical protein AALP_AA1G315800 [Arabis alpina]